MSNNNKDFLRFLYTGCVKDDAPFEVSKRIVLNISEESEEMEKYCKRLLEIIDDTGNDSAIEMIKKVAKNEGYVYNTSFVLLALAACTTNDTISAKAYGAVEEVCKTSEAILQFISYCAQLSRVKKKTTGWGRVRRTTVQKWYRNKRPYDVAFSITSCQSYNHWNHKDLWKLCHIPIGESSSLGMKILCSYIMLGYKKTIDKFETDAEEGSEEAKLLNLLQALKEIKSYKVKESGEKVAKLVIKHGLTWDHLPCQWHNDATVWKQLLNYLPLEVILKNLPRLHNLNVLQNNNAWQKCVVERILLDSTNPCLHPFTYFWHRTKYEQGFHFKRKYRWNPNIEILSALDVAFYSSMKCIKSSGKNLDVTVDLTSPGARLLNSQYHLCSQTVAALCYVLLHHEDQSHDVNICSKRGKKISILKEDTIGTIKTKLINETDKNDKKSNCIDFARPIINAKKQKRTSTAIIDTFIIITDAVRKYAPKEKETLPWKALDQYEKANPKSKARLITISVQSNALKINEKQNTGILEIAGLDDKVPSLILDFITEKF